MLTEVILMLFSGRNCGHVTKMSRSKLSCKLTVHMKSDKNQLTFSIHELT